MGKLSKRKVGFSSFIISVMVVITAQLITELSWTTPTYNPVLNWVSDLGVPVITTYGTHVINSPLYFVMNIGFILSGIIYLFGFFTIKKSLPNKWLYKILPLTYSLGLLLIGIFPGYDWSFHMFHPIGALLFLLSGEFLAIDYGVSNIKKSKGIAIFQIFLGVVSFIAIPVMFSLSTSGIEGLIERLAIYPVFIALIIRSFIEIKKA